MSIIKLTNLMSDNYEVLWSNIINPVQLPQRLKGSSFLSLLLAGTTRHRRRVRTQR